MWLSVAKPAPPVEGAGGLAAPPQAERTTNPPAMKAAVHAVDRFALASAACLGLLMRRMVVPGFGRRARRPTNATHVLVVRADGAVEPHRSEADRRGPLAVLGPVRATGRKRSGVTVAPRWPSRESALALLVGTGWLVTVVALVLVSAIAASILESTGNAGHESVPGA